MNNGIVLVISDLQVIAVCHSGSVSFKNNIRYYCFWDQKWRVDTTVGIRVGLGSDLASSFFFPGSVQAVIKQT